MSEHDFGDLGRRDTERHLLAAVDESENSKRAVMFLADFFSDSQNVFITLLSIISEPSEDFFPTETERQAWLQEKETKMQKQLAGYKEILLGAGFPDARIAIRLSIRPGTISIGDAILEEQEKLRCCIVVVGRRGISHSEEFVFGSTSSKILHHAKHCAVMVVE
ncbi:MAG TPA: universal stress protein [Desulfurivibrionaceae bacterium]|jgi:nucleotide-binding universal stress UspA family protein